jgi:hypothetical protein
MAKTDNLKLSILVNGAPVYFGAPVIYSQKEAGGELTLIMQTEIGKDPSKQKIEIQIKNNTYVEPIVDTPAGNTSPSTDI